MATEDRGIALGLVEFIAILVVAGLIFIALSTFVPDIISTASGYTADVDAQSHIDTLGTIWGLILGFVVFVAGLFMISRSVFESKGP